MDKELEAVAHPDAADRATWELMKERDKAFALGARLARALREARDRLQGRRGGLLDDVDTLLDQAIEAGMLPTEAGEEK